MNTESLLPAARFRPDRLSFPDAWCAHIPFGAWLIRQLVPSIFVELGTHSGNSYLSFCQSIREGGLPTRCYAVDTWRGDEQAGHYGEEIYASLNGYHQPRYADFSQLLRMSFDEAVDYFSDGTIELLHIDGLHTYEAVLHDFENWLPKLAPHAVVLFHDTNVRERGFGVWKVWEELRTRYPLNIEFIHSHGLGVLQLAQGQGAFDLAFLKHDSCSQPLLLDYFSSLGAHILETYRVAERDGQIVSLNQVVAERDGQVASLNQAVAERDGQVASLNQAVAERDGVVSQILASTSWRVTRPLRAVKSLFSGIASAIVGPPKCFDADWYLKQNPDVAMSGMEPYQHYVSYGKKEGRQFAPDGRLLSRIKRIQLFRILLSPRPHRFLIFLALNPSKIIPSLAKIHQDWRKEGLPAVKRTITNLLFEVNLTALWVTYKEKFGRKLETTVRDQISRMQVKPLISVLMPTYNTPEAFLRQAIESVRMQLYPNWELCVSDDGSNQPQVRRVLEEYASLDDRIKLRFNETNTNVSMATNRALELAKGGYVLLLDHDDLLEKQALFRVAESIQADDPDFIYSDEALISKDGRDVHGYVFRPSFSLEFLRSHPYIIHSVAFRTTLLREIGGLDASLTISQDYDLILRVVEKAATIVHIPEVLYLWRQHRQSAGHDKKEQVAATSRQILERHLSRCGEPGIVEYGESFNFFEIRYPLTGKSKVAIIIPTKNHGDLVRQCVESIERTVHQVSYEIVVIDHASSDNNSLEYFERLKSMRKVLRYEGAFNFSAINNWAVSQLDDSFTHFLFCNNDIEAIEDGWLERMMELGQKTDVGIVGAALFYPDRHVYQHAGVCVGMYGAAEHYGKFMDKYLSDGMVQPGYLGNLIANHEVSAVTAACLLMREDAFKEIGGYDEKLVIGFGDVDLCLRARQTGYRVIFCPHAALIHRESYTRGKSQTDPHPKDSEFFRQRWKFILNEGDPYFNPNLSLMDTRWIVKKPLEFRLTLNRRIFKQILLPATGHQMRGGYHESFRFKG